MTIDLTESGAAVFYGPVTVSLYASTTTTLSGAELIATPTSPTIVLKAGQIKPVSFRISSLPATLPGGTYYIIAQTTGPGGASITAASAGTITVAPASIRLSGAISALDGVVTPGKSASAVINVSNAGNISAIGVLQIALYGRPTGGGADIALGTVAVRIHIKPGGTGNIRIRIPIPAALATGSYSLVAQLDPQNVFAASSPSSPIVSPTTFSVA